MNLPKAPILPLVVALIAGLLFAAAGGYSIGSHRPVKTVTVTKEKETVKETQIVQQKVDLSEIRQLFQDYQKEAQAHVVTRTVIVKAPDGTVTTTVSKDSQTASKVDSKTSQETKVAEKVETKAEIQKERVVDRVVTVEVNRGTAPTWSLSLGAGVSVPALLGGQTPPSLLPFVPGKYVGHLSLTRHLLGPLSGGPWVDTRGDAGLVLETRW